LELDDMVQEFDEPKIKPHHSRLAIKQELGGKDRVFAIVDYWTQVTLEPLHSKLASILRTIKNDCTFDQGKGVEEIKQWTIDSNEIYSYDLKSATDRFPLKLQVRTLKELTSDEEYSNNWGYLIANRTFKYKKISYKWGVGQPLGAYSSWPIFAYSHHLVVREAARLVNVKDPPYFLLGDDIVIKGRLVAEQYHLIMKSLGVDISETKTISGCHAEFAKRIFSQGIEISPTPVKLLLALQRDPFLIKETFEELYHRSSNKEAFASSVKSTIISFSNTIKCEEKRKMAIVLGTGFLREKMSVTVAPIEWITSIWPPCNSENYETVRSCIKYKYLISTYNESANLVSKYENQIGKLELWGLTPEARTIHPVYKALEKQKSFFTQAHRSIGKYWSALRGQNFLDSETLPCVKRFDLEALTKSHRSRIKHNAKIVLQTWSALKKAEKILGTRLDHEIIQPGALIRASGEGNDSKQEVAKT